MKKPKELKNWNFVPEVNHLEITCHALGTPFSLHADLGIISDVGEGSAVAEKHNRSQIWGTANREVGIVKKFSHHSTTEPLTITKDGIKLSREQCVYMSPSSYNIVYLKVNISAKVRSSFCHAPLSLNAPRF